MCALRSDLSTCTWSTNRKIERTTRSTGRRTSAFKELKTRSCMQERTQRYTKPPSTWPTSSTSSGSSRRHSQLSNVSSCCTRFLWQINWSKPTLESNQMPSQSTPTSPLALLLSISNTCPLRTPLHSTARSTWSFSQEKQIKRTRSWPSPSSTSPKSKKSTTPISKVKIVMGFNGENIYFLLICQVTSQGSSSIFKRQLSKRTCSTLSDSMMQLIQVLTFCSKTRVNCYWFDDWYSILILTLFIICSKPLHWRPIWYRKLD